MHFKRPVGLAEKRRLRAKEGSLTDSVVRPAVEPLGEIGQLPGVMAGDFPLFVFDEVLFPENSPQRIRFLLGAWDFA